MTPARLVQVQGKADDPFADFRNFVNYLFTEVRGWAYVGAIQYDIAAWMQDLPLCKDGKRRGQVQSMRGAGKTEIAVAFCLWLLYLDPDIKILAVSSVALKAQEFTSLARQLIDQTPLLYHLKPHLAKDGLVSKDQKDNLHGFVVGAVTKVSKELSLASYAIYGTYTGCHPDVVVGDDIETPENSLTVGKREKLLSKIYEFENLVNPGGITLLMGTPQSWDSVYMKMEKKGYAIRRWPDRYPDLRDERGCRNVSPTMIEHVRVGVVNPGAPTYPERFGDDQLDMKLAVYGPTMYALQMKLDTSLADEDRFPLKLRNFIVMDMNVEMAPERVVWGTGEKLNIDPQGLPGDCFFGPAYREPKYAPYTQKVMYIDPKGGGADTVGWAVTGALNGIIYNLATGGVAKGEGNVGYAEPVLEKLARVALKYGVQKVGVEDNFGDGMYRKLLTPVMARINGPTEVVDVHSKGQKELRIIDTLEVLTSAHRLVITPEVAANDELMHQYCFITRMKGSLAHDDLVEALSGACAMLADLVVLDPEKRVQQEKKAETDRLVREFRTNAIGFVQGRVSNMFGGNRVSARWKNRMTRQTQVSIRGKRPDVPRKQGS